MWWGIGLSAVGLGFFLLIARKGVQIAMTTGEAWRGGIPIGFITLKSVGKSADSGKQVYLETSRADAFLLMQAEALKAGVKLFPNSGFRTMIEQTAMYAAFIARLKKAPVIAVPGTSNHQDGTAIDIKIPPAGTAPNSPERLASKEYRWLVANANRFGFYNAIASTKEAWHWSSTGR